MLILRVSTFCKWSRLNQTLVLTAKCPLSCRLATTGKLMDGEDDYDNYFDDDWTWNSDRKPGLGVFHFVVEARECALGSIIFLYWRMQADFRCHKFKKLVSHGAELQLNNRASTSFCIVFPMTYGYGLVIFLSKTLGFFNLKKLSMIITKIQFVDMVVNN